MSCFIKLSMSLSHSVFSKLKHRVKYCRVFPFNVCVLEVKLTARFFSQLQLLHNLRQLISENARLGNGTMSLNSRFVYPFDVVIRRTCPVSAHIPTVMLLTPPG